MIKNLILGLAVVVLLGALPSVTAAQCHGGALARLRVASLQNRADRLAAHSFVLQQRADRISGRQFGHFQTFNTFAFDQRFFFPASAVFVPHVQTVSVPASVTVDVPLTVSVGFDFPNCCVGPGVFLLR